MTLFKQLGLETVQTAVSHIQSTQVPHILLKSYLYSKIVKNGQKKTQQTTVRLTV